MSSDLEKFLQQAAERLAQKANPGGQNRGAGGGRQQAGGGQRPGGNRPKPGQRPAQAQRRQNIPQVVEAEILEPDPVQQRRLREMGPDPLSTIDTRPALAQVIDQADERMQSHVHQVFDHQLGNIKSATTSANMGERASQTDQAIEVSRRIQVSNPLIKMLRNPETLKAAFIAGEIFNRRHF